VSSVGSDRPTRADQLSQIESFDEKPDRSLLATLVHVRKRGTEMNRGVSVKHDGHRAA
jgi:hypothetical protein